MLMLPLRRAPHVCAGILCLSGLTHVILYLQGRGSISFDVNSFANFGLMGIGGLAGIAADRPLPRAIAGNLAICMTGSLLLILPLVVATFQLWVQVGRLSGVLVALLLIQVYQQQKSWPVGVLDVAPLRRLGVISYGAYLFHLPIGTAAASAMLGYHAPPFALRVVLELGATIALAELSWRFLEAPCRNLARGRMGANSFT